MTICAVPHIIAKYTSRNHEFLHTHTGERNMFKSALLSIYSFICALRKAGYAANLARNGKISQAQEMYKD